MSDAPVNRDVACYFGAFELYDMMQRQSELSTAAATTSSPPTAGTSPSDRPAGGSSSSPTQQHNEVVIDTHALVASLPDAIEAFFFSTHSSAADIKFARVVHQKFLEEHGLSNGRPGAPPLLLLDLAETAGGAPFSEPGPAWLEDEHVEAILR